MAELKEWGLYVKGEGGGGVVEDIQEWGEAVSGGGRSPHYRIRVSSTEYTAEWQKEGGRRRRLWRVSGREGVRWWRG